MKYQSKNTLQNSIYVSLALSMTLGSGTLLAAEVCDIDGNNTVTQNDIDLIFQAKNNKAISPFDPMDIDRNGIIDTNDARLCVCALSTTTDCTIPLNQAPIANTGSDLSPSQLDTGFNIINLDGHLSSDPDKDSLLYQWSFQQKPEGSQVTLSGANSITPSFIPDQFGLYSLSLIVSDGFGKQSQADFITINLSNSSPFEATADTNTAQAGGTTVTGNLLSNDTVNVNKATIIAPLMTNASTPQGGVFSLQANGDYSYTPPLLLSTAIEEELTYTITRTDGKQSHSTLTIKVHPSLPLEAFADTNIAQAGRVSASGNLLNNDNVGDRTINLSPLFTSVSTPRGGIFSLQNNGDYSYIPPQSLDAEIEEVLSYTITGLDGKQSTSTLTITTSPNFPLRALADKNTVQAGGVTATGNLLSNDIFKNRNISLTPLFTNISTPKGAVFSLGNNGEYSYTPPQFIDNISTEKLTYTITGLDGIQSSSTLTITVNPPSPLEAIGDTNTTQAGGSAATGNVLGNDIFDNRIINITPLLSNFSTLKGGLFSLQNDGNYTYLPPQSINTTIEERITYTITGLDSKQSSASLIITVNPNNQLPLARPDSHSVTANGAAISGNVLTNDDKGNQPTKVAAAVANIQIPSVGIFSLQINGNYTYTPPKNIESVQQEIFNYTITDVDGEVSSSTLTIVINPENRQPVASHDLTSTTAGSSAITGNVLTNDDLGNQPTTLSSGATSNFKTPQGGEFSLADNGIYSYTPPKQIAGVTTEKFNYSITDIDGESSTATLTIQVSPQNLTPLANPDSNNASAGGTVVTGNVLTNDTQGNAPVSATLTSSNANNVGSLNLDANGVYRYTPPSALSGVVTDVFTYTMTDQDGETSTSTLTIQVSPQNLTPLANPDSNNASAGGTVVTGNVLTNDTQGNAPVSAILTSSNANNVGSLNLDANGVYRYTPPSALSGVVTDVFTYTMTDQDGETSTSTLTIQVSPQNLTPTANPDTQDVKANIASNGVKGNVLSNDILGNTPTNVTPITRNGTQSTGSLNLQANGDYLYSLPSAFTPTVRFTEVFQYTIVDNDNETSSSTLTINIDPNCNAVNDTNQVTMSGTNTPSSLSGNVTNNDTSCASPLAVTPIFITFTQLGGAFELSANGRYIYSAPRTPITSEQQESFTYSLTDNNGETSSATLVIIVKPATIIVPPITTSL